MDSGVTDKEFTLPSGQKMPAVGYGCWKVDNDKCADIVYTAIKAGYRLLDEAGIYANEVECGQGIKRAIDEGIVKREELFVTSKLWNTYHRKEHVKLACQKSLTDLGLDYIDLYLIHFPISLKFVPIEERYPPFWHFNPETKELIEDPVSMQETWQAMEELVNEGLVKNIGVSNIGCTALRDMFAYAKIKPANLQVELHPYLTQETLIKFCHTNNITVTAYSSFGAPSYERFGRVQKGDYVLEDPVFKGIAEAVGKTPGQVALRWGIQRGTAVIPKSMNEGRMAQNLDIYSFSLTEEQMKAISDLNKNHRFNELANYGLDLPIFQ